MSDSAPSFRSPSTLADASSNMGISSKETGSISVAIGGMLKRHLKPETLENLLRNELLPREEDDADKPKFNLLNLLNLLKPRKNGGADDDE